MIDQVLSIQQMQELEALGLDLGCGSMYWHNYNTDEEPEYELCSTPDFEDIPTYTLQDILYTLNTSNKLTWDLFESGICVEDLEGNVLHTEYSYNLLKASFNLLKWCKKNNYILYGK